MISFLIRSAVIDFKHGARFVSSSHTLTKSRAATFKPNSAETWFLRNASTSRFRNTPDPLLDSDEKTLKFESAEIPDPKLVEYLTKEKIQELTGNVTAKYFKLEMIKNELLWLNKRMFPLPESMSAEEWQQLIRIRDRIVRTKFLYAIYCNALEERLDDILKEDEKASRKITFHLSDFLPLANAEDDPYLSSKVVMLNSLVDQLIQEGEPLPIEITASLIKDLYYSRNRSQYLKTLRFYGFKRQARMNTFIKKKSNHIIGDNRKRMVKEKISQNQHLVYGLGHNVSFIRFDKKRMLNVDNWRTIREFNEWGQPLVIDFSFVKDLSMKNARSLIFRELFFGLARNRASRQPFAIYVTNFDKNCEKSELVLKMDPSIIKAGHPVYFTEKSYMDIFPQKNLLYLSPDSRNMYSEYNGEDILIVGGLFNSHTDDKTTLAKAKKQNIRHACLPFRNHIGFNVELNLDHVIAAMCDYRNSKDWFYACRWIPSRLFRNRYVFTGNPRDEAIYKAHHKLSPQNSEDLNFMDSKKYRKLFTQYMKESLANP